VAKNSRPAAEGLSLAGHTFLYVGEIEPLRSPEGRIIVDQPYRRSTLYPEHQPHHDGEGPFCRFKIPTTWSGKTGVYLIMMDGQPMYAGECVDLAGRFNSGYGNISPRNCFPGGQPTNCRLNRLILEAAQNHRSINLYFHPTSRHKEVEKELLRAVVPPWNRQSSGGSKTVTLIAQRSLLNTTCGGKNMKTILADQIRDFAFRRYIEPARKQGQKTVTIRAGDVHSEMRLGQRMPAVCGALGTDKFQAEYQVELIDRKGPNQGANVFFTFKV